MLVAAIAAGFNYRGFAFDNERSAVRSSAADTVLPVNGCEVPR
jgi:hypothetical protein